MRLFDSHAHLNLPEFTSDRKNTLARAREACVTRIVNVGVDAASARVARDLALANDGLFATAAVHPNYVKSAGPDGFPQVRDLIREGGFVAVGETGLDYYREHSPFADQRRSFHDHIALADEHDLPLIVHCREAHIDCRAILREESETRGLESRVILHCFGGTAEDARDYVELGFLVSFAGNLTYPSAKGLREAARIVPLDRTLVETDCPWLAPQPRRGKQNEPAYVAFTARALADLHGISVEDAAEATYRNACRIFGIEEEQ